MTDKPIVVAGSDAFLQLLASPGPAWLERRLPSDDEAVDAKTFTGGIRDIKQGITPFTRIPMIVRPQYLVDPHIMGDGLTKGFPLTSFVTHKLGIQHTGKRGYSDVELFHDLEYVSNMPYVRHYRNTLKVIPMPYLYGKWVLVGGRMYEFGHQMASSNLFGFDHRPDQAMSAIEIRGTAVVVGGYEIPGLTYWTWGEHRSAMKSLMYGDGREGINYPEYAYHHQVEKLRVNGQRKFYFPVGMPDGGLRRDELSVLTSDCRVSPK